MEFLFADYTQKTEALVTGIRLQNEAFGIYELQLLGLDKKDFAAIPTVEQQQYQIQNYKNCCTQKDCHFQMGLSGSG